MARTRLIAGIAFAGLGLGLFQGPSHAFSQNPSDARTETQAALTKYCTPCHNERLKTAGLALDPAGVTRPGDQAGAWEKVLRPVSAGSKPPPNARRPSETFLY